MSTRKWTVALLPLAIFYLFFFIFPQAAFLRASFFENGGLGQLGDGPTLQNYKDVLADSYYQEVVLRTLELSGLVAVVGVVIAFPIAFAIARSRTVWGRVLFLLVVASMFTSAIVRALGWRVLLADSGPINDFLLKVGLIAHPVHLANNFLGVFIGLVHVQLPLLVLGMMPVCEAVPRNLSDAAQGLGASRWYSFWRVTFPLTRIGIIGIGLLIFATTTGAFTTPTLLGGGRVGVMSILIRQQTLQTLNYPLGATLAVITVFIVFSIVSLALLFTRKRPIPMGTR